MNTILTMFLNNDVLDSELDAFCTSDPEYLQTRQQFYETAEKIAKHIGSDQYDAFERSFSAYLYRTADLYYLYGLGLRQEVLDALKK